LNTFFNADNSLNNSEKICRS